MKAKANHPVQTTKPSLEEPRRQEAASNSLTHTLPSSAPIQMNRRPFMHGGWQGDFISTMGNQFDPSFRTQEHTAALARMRGRNIFSTFHHENPHAAAYPMAGARSGLGMMGIAAHRAYRPIARHPFGAAALLGAGALGYGMHAYRNRDN